MPVVWAAALLGSRIPERVTGADIVPVIAALAAERGYRVFMLGSRPDTLRAAGARLAEMAPGLKIVGMLAPPVASLDSLDTPAILAAITQARPDILLVAFGNPKQEKWIHRKRVALSSVPVCMGIGGTFDFIAGNVRRAPGWMQRCGLEWLHRLAHDPGRLWKRYSRDFKLFTSAVIEETKAVRRLKGRSVHIPFTIDRSEYEGGACVHLRIAGSLLGEEMRTLRQYTLGCAVKAPRRLSIDLTEITAADAESAATLLLMETELRARGVDFHVTGIPEPLSILMRVRTPVLPGSNPQGSPASARLRRARANNSAGG